MHMKILTVKKPYEKVRKRKSVFHFRCNTTVMYTLLINQCILKNLYLIATIELKALKLNMSETVSGCVSDTHYVI